MIDAMPRPRPPHLHRERSRHGALIWYVRIGHGPRIRLRAGYGTADFEHEYQAALRGERPAKGRVRTGTLSWLIDRYRDSAAWSSLSEATRRQRLNILKHIEASAGKEAFAEIDRQTVVAGMDRRKATPAAARHFLDTLKGLFGWAVNAGLAEMDPTEGLKRPKQATEGHHTWAEDEIARFEERWPLGTRERLAFDVLLYTGLRRGDAAALGKQHIRGGVIRIKTEKTGEPVTIPILPPLAASIAAGPTGPLAIIATENGRPMTKEALGNIFAEACKAAGVPGRAHGLRKAGATRAAENGATVAQLEAIFGWRGGGMASLYTRKANRERLATEAATKLLKR